MARGASNSENTGGLKYWSVAKGKFVTRLKEPTDETITRKLAKGANAGKEVHELHYDNVEGELLRVYFDQGKFGTELKLVIDQSTETEEDFIEVSLGKATGTASMRFLFRLPNIDLSKDVRISGVYMENKDKKGEFNAYYTPKQDGKTVENRFSYEDINKKIPYEIISIDGEERKDRSKQLDALVSMVEKIPFKGYGNTVDPSVKAEQAKHTTQEQHNPGNLPGGTPVPTKDTHAQASDAGVESDDLPF